MIQMTQRNRQTVDACRFCWMCRHICPVGNATGQERNTARARALGISLVLRDAESISNVIDNVYECMLCGACTKECATGWDPIGFTTELRLQGALQGVMPDYISTLFERIENTGHPYKEDVLEQSLADEIASLPKQSGTLLFLGADARYKAPAQAVAAIRLLKRSGLDFTVLANEPNGGYSYYFLSGPSKETQSAMTNTAAQLAPFEQVIVADPCEAAFFVQKYPQWNIPLNSSVRTLPAILADLIDSGKLAPGKTDETYAFQDPFALARDLDDTRSAREILNRCGTLHEMLLNGKDTMAAGSVLMREYMPAAIDAVALRRWIDAKNSGAQTLVTASFAEYACLAAVQPTDMNLMTLEEVILKCL